MTRPSLSARWLIGLAAPALFACTSPEKQASVSHSAAEVAQPAPSPSPSSPAAAAEEATPPRVAVTFRAPQARAEGGGPAQTGKPGRALSDEATKPKKASEPPPPPPKADALAATAAPVTAQIDQGRLQPAIVAADFTRCLSGEAQVSIDATILPSGDVLEASAARSVPDEPKLRDCVVDVFRALKFPPAASTEPAKVGLDLVLRPR